VRASAVKEPAARARLSTIHLPRSSQFEDQTPRSLWFGAIEGVMKRKNSAKWESTREPTETALRACLIAKDAVFNAQDYIATKSQMALIAVQQCEKELDQIERQIDESMPAAITEVTEPEARELLGCMKFTIDLERVGDLMWSVARRIQNLPSPLNSREASYLTSMADTLQEMLARVHQGFLSRDLELAESVLRMDSKINDACHAVFSTYLEKGAGRRSYEVTHLLFMAQAFERAGDHTKNLAEELVHLVAGHSVRHVKKTRAGMVRSRRQR
jgi:phosphate transport system protein